MDIYRTIVSSAIFVVLIVLFDLYSWQAVKTIIDNPQYLRMARRIHFGVTVAVVIGLLAFMFLPQLSEFRSVKTYFYALCVGIYLSKLVVVFFLLVDDFIRFFRWVFQEIFYRNAQAETVGGQDISRIAFLSQAGLLVGGVLLAMLTKGLIKGAYDYQVHFKKLKLDNLPEAFRGLRILQISDIHSGSWTDEAAVQKGIDMIKEQKADVIFFTGDLVNNTADEADPWINHLSEIKAPMGVYSILGNHDYGDYVSWNSPEEKIQNLDKLKQHHKDLGWKLMLNEHTYLEKDGARIGLIGIESFITRPFPLGSGSNHRT